MIIMSLLEELQFFFINGTTADFAFAVIFGQTFSVIISSLVAEIILPVLSAGIYKMDFDNLNMMVHGTPISYGPFLGHVMTFILSMLLVFFIFIKPFKAVIEKSKQKERSQTELSRVEMCKAITSLQNIEIMLSSSSQRLRL